ncbi:hypothetical protein HBI56_191840 [Parastagonospora nodorum]|uniref:Uncharacterized protein n=2 Tax=Phaeosphaeria nodorum (strain SN15 / ATCC MYA-4574 / FGSC 10173) TaxID=321614 RepID=A0A7U2IAC6_PHANO|nr:hypothetical protein SNOG_14723 [Parastagonospora nodorum SN15]KAH3908162.1 hypothetical protein HBH56_178500 [Parastagonospora nodorum]EAT77915.1 hypothetical protein SNOG_14723 [Parastagonospora nodorum SN15]KAH3932153.1 hypothetical protein HBH54_091320 [Parastagonospora nodorum]KAH3939296.1 hypothetical protein HBH53_237060 [Parastagonospora nodorum]KAH3956850.1 hypothetical protein HBH51_234170 [Parastagonospora nodorum]
MSNQTHAFESSIVIGSRTGGGRRSTSPKDGHSNPVMANSTSLKEDSRKPGMGKELSTFRALGRQKRGSFARGPKVEIRAHDGQVLASLPLALFSALSTVENLVLKDKSVFYVTCPEYLLVVAVKDLIARITPLANPNLDVMAMDTTNNLFKDIHIASAAEFLGLTAYTQRMFNAHWHLIKTCLPSQDLINLLTTIHTPLGDKLLDIIALRMAKHSWAGDYNDSEFEEYLAENSRFDAMVKVYLAKWEASSKAFEAREAHRRSQAEHRDLAAERQLAAEYQALANAQKDRAKERAIFAAKEQEDVEVGVAVRAKIQTKGLKGSKFSPREANYIWTHMGKRVPISSGG